MGDLLEKWQLGDEVARGARSTAYLAGSIQAAPPKRALVKLLRSDAGEPEREAFLRAAVAASLVQHRNAVVTFDVFDAPGETAWVMEHLDGVTAGELARSGLPPLLAVRIVADTLAAVEAVHRRVGLVTNVDADHVLVTREGRVKLLLSQLGATRDVAVDVAAALRLLADLAPAAAADDRLRKLREQANGGSGFRTAHALRVALEDLLSRARPEETSIGALANLVETCAASRGATAAAADAPRVRAAEPEPPAPVVEAAPEPAPVVARVASEPPPPVVARVASELPPPMVAPVPAPSPEALLDTDLAPVAGPARLQLPSPRAAPSPDGGVWPSLRNRSFALLMACFVIANTGARMQTSAMAWLIFKRSNDPLYLGWFGLAFALPMLLLAPLGGILADRIERVRLLSIAKALYLVLSIVLELVNRTGHLSVGAILTAQAGSAVLLSFEHPTRLSLVPDFVPRKHLQNALAVNGVVNYATLFAGPALAGWLLESRGPSFVFVLAGVAALAGIALLLVIPGSPPRVARHEKITELFFGGLRHVKRDAPVVALLVLASVVGASARTYPDLLPMFARTWGAGAKGFGMLASASGIGGMLSVVALAFAPNLKSKDAVLVASVAGLCAALVGFAFIRSIQLAAVIMVLAGACATVFQNLGTNFLAARVPPTMLGRVLGLYTITLFGLPGFGTLAMTSVARKTSGGTALLLAVGLSIVALLVTAAPLLQRKRPLRR